MNNNKILTKNKNKTTNKESHSYHRTTDSNFKQHPPPNKLNQHSHSNQIPLCPISEIHMYGFLPIFIITLYRPLLLTLYIDVLVVHEHSLNSLKDSHRKRDLAEVVIIIPRSFME